MLVTTEGTIEIALEDFWIWVGKQHASMGEIVYGVPRVNKSNSTIEIDFATSTDGSPADWAVKSKAFTQWAK